ncbi:DNA-3-methyladenine glycosylase [Streptosporangium oxazolinicum]|uniref:DNA-3-methyladenine glycosylase II n=1 Tax=Streptosporangium oxazolinicum TaxID=909287 RepID=A0ABP8BN91_9ACTN
MTTTFSSDTTGGVISAFEHQYRHLAGREPVFARLLDEYGRPDPFEWHDGGRTGASHFAAMALHIIGQRISATVAFVVFDRIAAATGGIPTPDGVIRLGAERLRERGLSRAKAAYVLDLAQRQASGLIDIENMAPLDDGEVIAALTAVRGIGLWSAQMFLIHQLHRPDVLPAGDSGIRRAVREAWRLRELPAVGKVRDMAAGWAPYRSYAAALLWRSLRPAGEPSDPKARALSRETMTDSRSSSAATWSPRPARDRRAEPPSG